MTRPKPAAVKTLPVRLGPEPGMPTGIHDPLWKKPDVANRVGMHMYDVQRSGGWGPPQGTWRTMAELAPLRTGSVERRVFDLHTQGQVPGSTVMVRAGSCGEIHRKYSFGGRLPAVNFHAMAVGVAVDQEGLGVLRAVVGRMEGGWGNSAALTVSFATADTELGGLAWEDVLDPPGDKTVVVAVRSPVLSAAFALLTSATVVFRTVHQPR